MKVLLASAPHADTFGYSMPPPGLLRLGGALRRAGHDVALEDLAHRLASGAIEGGDALAESAAELLYARGRPDLLGLSVMGATLPVALLIAREVRGRWPGVPILLGGPGMNGTDVQVLERFDEVDAVVRGEAEVTLPELCAELERASGVLQDAVARVDGVTFRGAHGVERTQDRGPIRDLDTLPDYAWDLLPTIRSYKEVTGEEDGLVPVDSGRGCVYDCSFCSIGRTWGRRSRPLPAGRLADEVAALRGIPGARRAYLCHDLFGAHRTHAIEFCDALGVRGIDVPWEVRARADHLDAELLHRMGAAGCDRVLLGIESGSARVRRRNQKGMRDDFDALQAVDDCAAAGITPILSLILGLPGEEEEDLDLTLEFCARAALRAGVQLSLHLVNPQPGCALGDELGSTSQPVDGIPPDMALGAGESAGERALIAAHPDLFSTWALLPMEPARLDELVWLSNELPETMMRFPRTFAALLALDRAAGRACERDDDRPGTALAQARALRADGRSFETFAAERAATHGRVARVLVDDLLTWETALVRVGARGPRRPRAGRWRVGGDLVDARVDLGRIGALLDEALASPGCVDLHGVVAEAPDTFAVVAPAPAPGRLAGVRTLRLASGAARLARAVETERDALERAHARGSLDHLVDLGVLVPPTSVSDAVAAPPSPAELR
ncbi:MAG: radical SAM protein [Planctomycetota bacterium]